MELKDGASVSVPLIANLPVLLFFVAGHIDPRVETVSNRMKNLPLAREGNDPLQELCKKVDAKLLPYTFHSTNEFMAEVDGKAVCEEAILAPYRILGKCTIVSESGDRFHLLHCGQ
eukprot:1470026-Rhodomonas_salina.1